MGFVLFYTTKEIKTFSKKMWSMSETAVKSKKEDEELQQGTKKVKEDHIGWELIT